MKETPSDIRSQNVEQKDASIELTQKEAQDVVFWSYYYSQGFLDLQRDILRYIGMAHPHWKLPIIDTGELVNRLHAFLERAEKKGMHEKASSGRTTTDTINEVRGMILSLELGHTEALRFKYSTEETQHRKVELGVKILRDMVSRDSRRNSMMLDETRTNTGPFRKTISHFVDYVLRGENPPGSDTYRELIRDLRAILQIPTAWEELNQKFLREILDFKKRVEPNTPIDLSSYPIPASVLKTLQREPNQKM